MIVFPLVQNFRPGFFVLAEISVTTFEINLVASASGSLSTAHRFTAYSDSLCFLTCGIFCLNRLVSAHTVQFLSIYVSDWCLVDYVDVTGLRLGCSTNGKREGAIVR